MASKFLQFTNQHIRVGVTGKRVDRVVGLGLEIPVKYFCRDARVITWLNSSLEKLDNELRVKVKKCVEQKHESVCFLFSETIIGCPLIRGKFFHAMLGRSVRYSKFPL